MADKEIHISTEKAISERLRKIIDVLDRENTPEEFSEAIKELKSLAEEVKVDYAQKPISKEAWENQWAGVIGDFIITFEHNAVDYEPDPDLNERFLQGMAKGMWTIYNLIEELMVREAIGSMIP